MVSVIFTRTGPVSMRVYAIAMLSLPAVKFPDGLCIIDYV